MDLDELRRLGTISVPQAGEVLGLGRDASYAAAERGEIPVLRVGRAMRVPAPRLLAMLGGDTAPEVPDEIARTLYFALLWRQEQRRLAGRRMSEPDQARHDRAVAWLGQNSTVLSNEQSAEQAVLDVIKRVVQGE
jgi:excisionase family DNA binding protein